MRAQHCVRDESRSHVIWELVQNGDVQTQNVPPELMVLDRGFEPPPPGYKAGALPNELFERGADRWIRTSYLPLTRGAFLPTNCVSAPDTPVRCQAHPTQ